MPRIYITTKGDGDCFFHAVFGEYTCTGENHRLETNRAIDMRRIWRDFLIQYKSISDPKMPALLKKELTSIFNIFLDRHEELTGKANYIVKQAKETKEKINIADREAQNIVNDITLKYKSDQTYRDNIYPLFSEEVKKICIKNELCFDDKKLKSAIFEELRSCVLKHDSNISQEHYDSKYNSEHISKQFINSEDLYQNYLAAIISSKYHVFFEEILILATLANITIHVYREHNESIVKETFSPKSDILNLDYKVNTSVWGIKKHEDIYYKPGHYERTVLIPEIIITNADENLEVNDSESISKSSIIKDKPELEGIVKNVYNKARNQIKLFSDEINQYIPLKCYSINEQKVELDLEEVCKKYLGDKIEDESTLLITGESGSGKTFFCQQLYINLWNNYKKGNPIPLWIPLGSIGSTKTLLLEVLDRYDLKSINNVLSEGIYSFILLLDAYDEMDIQRNIYESLVTDKIKFKVVVTCRSDAIFKSKRHLLLSKNKSNTEIIEYHVLPFKYDQIEAYINKFVLNTKSDISVDEYLSDLKLLPNVIEIAENPYVLFILLQILPEIIHEKENAASNIKLTRYTIYDRFTNAFFQRQMDKIIKNLSILPELSEKYDNTQIKYLMYDYCVRLATYMFQNHVSSVTYSPGKNNNSISSFTSLSISDNTENDNLKEFFDDSVPILKIIRSGCPIRITDSNENRYAFKHKSLLEFFAAKHIFSSSLIDASYMAERDLNREVITDRTVIRFLVDLVHTNSDFKMSLFSIIEMSKFESAIVIAACNSITILNLAKVSFSNKNFRRIRIGGIYKLIDKTKNPCVIEWGYDLKGNLWQNKSTNNNEKEYSFYGADLSGGVFDSTDFSEADLRGVNFTEAWLKNANLSSSALENINISSNNQSFEGIKAIYSEDGKYLSIIKRGLPKFSAGYNYYYKIEIYDISSYQLKITIELPSAPERPYFSFDNTLIASIHDDELLKRELSLASLAFGVIFKGFVFNAPFSQEDICSIKLWNFNSGKCEKTLIGHTEMVRSLAWHKNKINLLSSSDDTTINLWDVVNNKCIRTYREHKMPVTYVCYHDDYKYIISYSTDQSIILWDVDSGSSLKSYKTIKDINISIFHDSESFGIFWISKSSREVMMLVKNSETNFISEEKLITHSEPIILFAYNTKHKILTFLDTNNIIYIINTKTNKCENKFHIQKSISEINISNNGKEIFYRGIYSDIYTLDINYNEPAMCKSNAISIVKNITFVNASSSYLLINIDNTLQLHNIQDMTLIKVLDDNIKNVSYMHSVNPSVILLLYKCVSLDILNMDVMKSLPFTYEHTGDIIAVASRNDGHEVALSHSQCGFFVARRWVVQIIDLVSQKSRYTSDFEGPVNKIKYTFNQKILACLSGGHVFLIDTVNCTQIKKLRWNYIPYDNSYPGRTQFIDFDCSNYRNELVALPEGKNESMIVNLDTFKRTYSSSAILKRHYGNLILFTGLKKLFIVLDKKNIHIYLCDEKEMLYKYNFTVKYQKAFSTACSSYDSKTLVTATNDGAYQVWDINEKIGKYSITLRYHSYPLFFCENICVEGSMGLSPEIYSAMKKTNPRSSEGKYMGQPLRSRNGGAIKSSEEALRQRNGQIFIPDGIIRKYSPDKSKQFIIDSSNWVVSLVRDKESQNPNHVFLIIEGVSDDKYSNIIQAELVLDQTKPRYFSEHLGTGLIRIQQKSPSELERRAVNLVSQSWQKPRKEVEDLIKNIESQKNKNVFYIFSGYSPKIFTGESYSCLTWCLEHLEKINIKVEKESAWYDFAIAIPVKFLPEKRSGAEAQETSSACYMM